MQTLLLPTTPDFYVVDHFAEFIYLPKGQLQELYKLDPMGYYDSIQKMMETLATSSIVGLPQDVEVMRIEVSKRLWQALYDSGKASFSPMFEPEGWKDRQSEALKYLSQEWSNICKQIEKNEDILESLGGHVRRELLYYYGKIDPSRTNVHYVDSTATLQLPPSVNNRLLVAIQPLCDLYQIKGDKTTHSEWINRNFTTHFRSYVEHIHFNKMDYVPGLTRSRLNFGFSVEEKARQRILPCIAGAIISTAKNRSDLLNIALDWIDSKKGQRILNGFSEFIKEIRRARTEEEKNKIWRELESILDAPFGIPGTALLRLIRIYQQGELEKIAPRLFWVWQLRGKNSRVFQKKVEMLLSTD